MLQGKRVNAILWMHKHPKITFSKNCDNGSADTHPVHSQNKSACTVIWICEQDSWTICLKVLLSSFKIVKCTILVLWLIHHLSLIFNVLPFLMLTMVILFLKNSESSKKSSSKSSSVSFKVFHKVLSSSWYLQNALKGILKHSHLLHLPFPTQLWVWT